MVPIDAARRFTALYDAYFHRVLAYARSRVGPAAAEEVASDTFVAVWERLADVPEPALPWLLGIARNLIREQRRLRDRQTALAVALDLDTRAADLNGADVAEQVTERAAVLHALATLSDADREALTLVAWQGLSAREAAAVVGCSQAAFWVRMHRARQRLQRATDALLDSPDAPPDRRATGGEPRPGVLTSIGAFPRPPLAPAPSSISPLHQEPFTEEHFSA